MKKTISILIISITLLLSGFQIFQDFHKEQIKIWDESRGAVNAVEMLQNGNCIVVTFDGTPDYWNSKPPLFVWLKVLCFKVFGVNEFSVRLPSVLAAFFTIALILFFSIKFLKNIWVGVLASLVMITSKGYLGYHVTRNGDPDSLLILFVTLYSLVFFIILEVYPKRKTLLLVLLGVFSFLAIFTKAIAGIAPMAGLAVYMIFSKKSIDLLKDWRFHLTWILVLLLISSYYFARELQDPGYFRKVLQTEIGLFADYYVGTPKHPEKSFYFNYLRTSAFSRYFWILLFSFPLLIFASEKRIQKFLLFCLVAGTILLVGFSMSVTKNEWYIATIYPFLSFAVGITLFEYYKILKYRTFEEIKTTVTQTVNSVLKPIEKILNVTGKFARKYATIIALIGAVLLFVNPYKWIYKMNRYDATGYIYEPERAGAYIRELYRKNLITDSTIVVSKYNHDQIKFYTKKIFFETKMNVLISSNLPEEISGKTIITDKNIKSSSIDSTFNCELLDEGKYCVLIRILDKK